MPMLVTGSMGYEEHGDCSELKRQIYINKRNGLYVAEAFMNMDFLPIGKGKLTKRGIKKQIDKYVKDNMGFYNGYNNFIHFCKTK